MFQTISVILISIILPYGFFGSLPSGTKAVLCVSIVIAWAVMRQREKADFFYQEPTTKKAPSHAPQMSAQPPVTPNFTIDSQPQQPQQRSRGSDYYSFEGSFIETVLNEQFKVNCDISGAVIKAPTYVGYQIVTNDNTTEKRLSNILEALASKIALFRDSNRIARGPKDEGKIFGPYVNLELSKPWTLQVTRPVTEAVNWDIRDKVMPREDLIAIFGIEVDHAGNKLPVYLDLKRTDGASTLFVGMSQSGKSTLMRAGVLSLIQNNSPAKLNIWMGDPMGDLYKPFEGCPHVMQCAQSTSEIEKMIDYFLEICNDPNYRDSDVCRLLVIDEWHRAVGENPDIVKKLLAVNQMIAKQNGKIFLTTQDPSNDIIPRDMKASFHNVFACYVDLDSYLGEELRIPGVSKLQKRTEALLRKSGQPVVRLNTFHVPEGLIMAEARMISAPRDYGQRYQEASRPPVFEENVIEVEAEAPVMSLRDQVYALRKVDAVYHNGRITTNKVMDHLFPGKGKGSKEYREIADLVKEVNGE